jgi:hypothetical protein
MAKNGFCSHFGVVSFVQLNVKVTFHFAVWAGAALLAGVGCVRAEDQIQVYTIPKEHPAAPLIQAQMSAGASDIPVNSAPVRWTTPAGWRELPPDGIRLGSFAVTGQGGKAEVAITSFPGTVGTELDNVNRWRGEVQLEPIGQNDLSAQPVTVDSCEGKLFDIAGTAARTVVAVVPRNGSSWFFKMKGDSTTVTAARPAYLEFLKSVHFGAEGGPAAAAPAAGGGADPHAGLPGFSNPHGEAAAPEAPAEEPKWSVPAQWVETPPRAMLFKSFSVAGDAGGKAEVTVSFFPGAVGGVLANVNRWRAQLSQKPVEAGALAGMTESVQTADGPATMVDFTGTDAKTGRAARMVAAIVPHGGKTWFYKLIGDGAVVGQQKDSFVNFVKTADYP